MTRNQIAITSAALLVAAFIVGVFAYHRTQDAKLQELGEKTDSVFNRAHSPVYGSPQAKVRIVEFFDPACETCRAFYPLIKQMVDAHPGQVQLRIRYTPLHEGSDTAVKILEAARLQGVFWPVAEAMLRAQPVWAAHDRPRPELIWDYLGPTGLNVKEAQEEMNTPRVVNSIRQDMEDARQLQVTRTPGFFVNGRPLEDFGHEQLKALVGAERQRLYGNTSK